MEDRLRRLENAGWLQIDVKIERGHHHLITVMANQHKRVDRAFDEVKNGLLEQELAVKARMQTFRDGIQDVRAGVGDLLVTAVNTTGPRVGARPESGSRSPSKASGDSAARLSGDVSSLCERPTQASALRESGALIALYPGGGQSDGLRPLEKLTDAYANV